MPWMSNGFSVLLYKDLNLILCCVYGMVMCIKDVSGLSSLDVAIRTHTLPIIRGLENSPGRTTLGPITSCWIGQSQVAGETLKYENKSCCGDFLFNFFCFLLNSTFLICEFINIYIYISIIMNLGN